jgi:hypothetical protein
MSDRRMRSSTGSGPGTICAVVAAVALGACSGRSVVVVSLTADPGISSIAKIRVTMSNAGRAEIRTYPQVDRGQPVQFPTSLAIVLPHSRSGTLDLAFDGLDASMTVVANGAAQATIKLGDRTYASAALTPGPAPCGNGRLDPGEECDDSGRASGDGCSFACRTEGSTDAGVADATADSNQTGADTWSSNEDGPSSGPPDRPLFGLDGLASDSIPAPPIPDGPTADLPVTASGALGALCTAAADCQSEICIDGRCCNLPCNGRCQACDVAGAEGKCTPIKAGDDPDNECDSEPLATCGRDGSCDGQGACRRYAVGTLCKPGSCANSTQTEASTCTAVGDCEPGSTKLCAAGQTCMNNSCASTCASDNECQNGFFCDTNQTCQVKRPLGQSCSVKTECSSGFCVDGVCCNLTCDQTCYACNLTDSVGTCNPVPDGMESGSTPECPADDVSTCGRIGGCNGRGACRLFSSGTPCAPQTCTGSTQSDVRKCNGVGVCQPGTAHDCGSYLCNGTACGTTCTTSAECIPGHSCTNGTCTGASKISKLAVHDTVAANVALWSIETNFQIGMTGAHPWGEAMWTDNYIKSIDVGANVLLGREWIKVASESKKYSGGPQATITLTAASDIYLVVDDRWGATPSWLSGWTNTGIHFQVWETVSSNLFQFTLWKKTGGAGDVDLPKIGASTAHNYFVIID